MESFYSTERSPMEFPWILRLLLRLRSWMLVRKDGTINRRMEKLVDKQVPPVTEGGVTARDVVIDQATGVRARIFAPAAIAESQSHEPVPVMFYFHGGGFLMLSASSPFADSFGKYLCKAFRAIVISVEYRKAPDHRYPAAYDDAHAVLKWAVEQKAGAASTLLPEAIDLSHCFLVGESAGGNIVHHVACRVAADPALAGKLTVIGNLALFPFFGGEERTRAELRLIDAPMLNYRMCDAAWKAFLPEGTSRDHPAANVAGPDSPDLSELPLGPFLVTIGEYDCLKDWQARYVERMKQMGKSVEVRLYKGGIHCFHVFPKLSLTSRFLADMTEFINSCLERPK